MPKQTVECSELSVRRRGPHQKWSRPRIELTGKEICHHCIKRTSEGFLADSLMGGIGRALAIEAFMSSVALC